MVSMLRCETVRPGVPKLALFSGWRRPAAVLASVWLAGAGCGGRSSQKGALSDDASHGAGDGGIDSDAGMDGGAGGTKGVEEGGAAHGGAAQGGAAQGGAAQGGAAQGGAAQGGAAQGGQGESGAMMGGHAGAGGNNDCSDDAPLADLRVPDDHVAIQAAINAAKHGDTIVVEPGTYAENLDFKGRAIRLVSAAGPALTIIDGQHSGPVVTFQFGEGRDSILEGFTIQNGASEFEGGVSISQSSPTIIKNVFLNNQQGAGGLGAGIGGYGASPRIDSNFFANNSCDDQSLSGVVSFMNHSSPLIVNNVFVNNPCRAITIATTTTSLPVVSNNTLANNHMGIRVDARDDTSTHLYLNNILIGGDVGLEVAMHAGAPLFNWTRNLVFGNAANFTGIEDPTDSNGNISIDPLLVDIEAADLHLSSASPAIDAGVAAAKLPDRDMDGDPRVLDGDGNGSELVDLGADEYSVEPSCATAL
jgi:hypothetical protein